MDREKQLRTLVKRQKQLICQVLEPTERDYITMMWMGYLSGMRLTNTINCQEYNSLYDEVRHFCEEQKNAQKGEKIYGEQHGDCGWEAGIRFLAQP